jgi:hypothetical protein
MFVSEFALFMLPKLVIFSSIRLFNSVLPTRRTAALRLSWSIVSWTMERTQKIFPKSTTPAVINRRIGNIIANSTAEIPVLSGKIRRNCLVINFNIFLFSLFFGENGPGHVL